MKIKRKIIYIISFFIPILIFCLIFAILKLNESNFSAENFLFADQGTQYISFYNYIKDVFLGHSSIFYSFSKGLGGNMASTLGYYLSSPLNVLYVFVSKADIPLMIFIIYVVKISLCSLFMCIFLSNKFGDKYTNIAFSLFYAFIGFTTVYHFNGMWIDVVYMTPFVMLGIEKLLKGKSTFYIITLALSMVFNFYIAYMLCIFCLIYFLYQLFKIYNIRDFKKYKKILIKFILSSILSFFVASFFLLPVIHSMKNIYRYSINTDLLNFNLIEKFFGVFSKTYIYSNDMNEFLGRERPVIYINLFCSVLLIYYFFNKRIIRREKILSFIVILFFWLSFIIPFISLVWHGFSFPNGYTGRFSFLYCFFIIYLSCKCFYNRCDYNFKIFIIISIIYVAIAIYINSLNFTYLSKSLLLFNCIIFIFYIILYLLFCNKNKKIYIVCIFFVAFLELFANCYNSILFQYGKSYKKFYNETCKKINNIEKNFYRIDGNYYYNCNDSFICNTSGIKTDISSSDKKIYNFLYNTGFSMTYIKVNYDYNELPIIDSLLGIKYNILFNKDIENFYDYYDSFMASEIIINENGIFDNEKIKVAIYKNPYALSLGYIVEDGLENKPIINNEKSSFENLNSLIESLSGIDENVLKPLTKQKIKNNIYKFNVDVKDKNLFFTIKYNVNNIYKEYGTLYINGEKIKKLNSNNIGISKIKNNYKNSEILLEVKGDKNNYIGEVDLYTFDLKNFEKAINKLKQNQLEDVVVKGNEVSGIIEVDKKSSLFLSIPYEKGWHVYVDGKKTPYYEIADAFIGVNIPKGKHKIEMKFYPPGLIIGGIITFISISVLCLNIYIDKKKRNKLLKSK